MTIITEQDRAEAAERQDAEGTSGVPQKPPASGSNKGTKDTQQFVVLTKEVISSLPPELQWTMYKKVLADVNHGTLPGMVHPSETGTLLVIGAGGAVGERSVKELLLRNTPKVRDQLDKMAETALSELIINTGGKGLSTDELAKMGDKLNFEAMMTAARKRRRVRESGRKGS